MKMLNKTTAPKLPADMLGLDFGSTGIKVVRIKQLGGRLTLVAADILPATAGGLVRPVLEKNFAGNYAAVCSTSPDCVVRVVSHTSASETRQSEQQIRDQIGLLPNFRLTSRPTGAEAVKGKNESRVLAVAVPQEEISGYLKLFATGSPAVYSYEISGLASLNAAFMGPMAADPLGPVCLLDCGARVSLMIFMNKGAVILARKLDVGGEAVVEQVQKSLGVDREMAESIMSEGAIDISQSVKEVIDPFLRQMMISRDFVERQENCRVATTLITGGMSLSPYWAAEIKKSTGMSVQTWDPLDGLVVASDAIPERLKGHTNRLSAAIGAARGAMTAP